MVRMSCIGDGQSLECTALYEWPVEMQVHQWCVLRGKVSVVRTKFPMCLQGTYPQQDAHRVKETT